MGYPRTPHAQALNAKAQFLPRVLPADPIIGATATRPKLLRFRYKNWRGNDHEYVIDPEKIEHGRYNAQGGGIDHEENWVLHGMIVTRDGDPRPDMGPTRRRTFLLTQIRDLEEIPRSR